MDTVDSDRLRFVAINFSFLQGLRWVPIGIGFLLSTIPVNDHWSDWFVAIPVMLILISYWKIGDYYKRRFGQAEVRPTPLRFSAVLSVAIIIVLIRTRHITKLDPFLLIMPVMFFNGPWSSLRRRWYYLLFVPVFLAFAFWQRYSIAASNMQLYLLGLYIIVTGILDHLLLVRSMPGLHQESND